MAALNRPQNKTDLANLALSKIGESKIDDIAGISPVAVDASTVIDQVILEVQADFPWPELKNTEELELDANYEAGAQDAYSYRFSFPEDYVQMARGVGTEKLVLKNAAGGFVDYDVEGAYIYTTADAVYLTYIAESDDPSGWSPWLVKAVTTLLAIDLAPMRNKSKTLTEQLLTVYEKLVRKRTRHRASKHSSTNRQRNLRPRNSRYHSAGRGH